MPNKMPPNGYKNWDLNWDSWDPPPIKIELPVTSAYRARITMTWDDVANCLNFTRTYVTA